MRDPMSVESRPSRTLAPALGCRWLRHARREGAPQAVAIEQSLYLENASLERDRCDPKGFRRRIPLPRPGAR